MDDRGLEQLVVFLDVRSNLLSGVGVKVREGMTAHERPDGITNYVRKIMEVEVKTLDETDDRFTMCELTIVGRAFLWHQIRSIFSVEDDSSEEEMTSRKRQRLEIDKPSHIDDKPFGTLDKPKSVENKDPHIIYGENNKEDDDTVRDIDGETTSMKADKDICDSKTSLKDNREENLETSENVMKGGEKVGRSTQEEIGESSVISYDTDQFDGEYLTTNTEVVQYDTDLSEALNPEEQIIICHSQRPPELKHATSSFFNDIWINLAVTCRESRQ
ncbi:hypothetical protein MAR_004982 [Mya arenaria]|uniref:Pseudouridine synthase I TruA alpha/beta domain-containing protein n=1 Tax=Mya arenaria TaxID=6604 RepID=A0ABY7F1B3_MYAAR|nr:hypothetical protein MAR_004982 [Mya arenaria]